MRLDRPRPFVCGVLPPQLLKCVSSNDSHWALVAGFEPVRCALQSNSASASVGALTAALRESRRPVDFRRWLRTAIEQATDDERSFLLAYQAYFEQQAG